LSKTECNSHWRSKDMKGPKHRSPKGKCGVGFWTSPPGREPAASCGSPNRLREVGSPQYIERLEPLVSMLLVVVIDKNTYSK